MSFSHGKLSAPARIPAAGTSAICTTPAARIGLPQAARLLADVRQPRHETVEFDRNPFFEQLCGQIVREEAILVAGAPRSNKSTLSRQLAVDLANKGQRVLFILTEENPERLKSAILKITSDWPAEDVKKVLANIHVETALHDVLMLPTFLTQAVVNPDGPFHGVSMIVIDSIQGPGLSANDFQRWQALFQATALTRATRIVTFLVCHVTKRGEIAGPKALEHAVDCTLLIRKAYNRRQIAVLKNRFGPETARPMQLELDATTVTLRPCPHAEMSPSVARGYLPGFGITEVQGAVTLPRPGSPARVIAPGLPRKEIEQYLAGICQIEGFELADFDLSIQCRLPGERRYRGVLGLPLCIALAAAYIQKPIPSNHVYLGEIDLCRNVRDVPEAIFDELTLAVELAEPPAFYRVLGPQSTSAQLSGVPGVEAVTCRKLEDAFWYTWPDLH
jgi:DNA repair protein RadA/Sms